MLILALALSPAMAIAECPAPPDVRSEMLNLIARSQAAKTYTDGRRASAAMWEVWLRAPDAAAQEVLALGRGQVLGVVEEPTQ